MREPEDKLNVDEDGIDRDVEELHWLLYQSGQVLVELLKIPALRMILGPEVEKTVGSLAFLCMEAVVGYEQVVDDYLSRSKMPQFMKPYMRRMMIEMRAAQYTDDDTFSAHDESAPYPTNQLFKRFGDEVENNTPFKLPPDLMDLLRDL